MLGVCRQRRSNDAIGILCAPNPSSSLSLSLFGSNDVDMIVFSVHDHSYRQCSDTPIGTYIVPVPTFVNAYLQQAYQNEQDKGNDDYAMPDNVAYTSCTQQAVQDNLYYLQLGCTDGTTQSLSVNIYKDETCSTRDTVDGFDDSNIDVSDIQVTCQPLVGNNNNNNTQAHLLFCVFLVRFLSSDAKLVCNGWMCRTIKWMIGITRIVQ